MDPKDNFDNFDEYEPYERYDDDFSLTSERAFDDDETPLTSAAPPAMPTLNLFDDDEPLDKEDSKSRPNSRKETIKQVAQDQQSGIARKPGVTAVDTRLTPPYSARRLSGTEVDPGSGRKPRRSSASSEAQVARRSSRPQQKSKAEHAFAAFRIVLLLVAVGVCLTVVIFIFGEIEFDGLFSAPAPTPSPTETVDITPIQRRDINSRETLLVTGVSFVGGERTLTLLDTGSRSASEFIVPDDARLLDRLNRPVTFPEIRVGHMVDIQYDINTFEIATLSESRRVNEHRSRTNVQIDIENWQVTLGNEVWSFNSQTLVLHRGENIPVAQIRPHDSVTLLSYGDVVWLIQLDAGHGYLQIQNADMIANGTITVGTSLFFRLDDITGNLTLPEGTHRVVVDGDNIETFIQNITIELDTVESLNLGGAQLRAALLYITVTPDDATIIINGEVHEGPGPAQVEFGEVHVRVERDGFLPQEERREVEAPVNALIFDLVEIVPEHTLTVFTSPTAARIYINDVFEGYSTLTTQVVAGTHNITARLHGYSEISWNVTVTGNETADIFQSRVLWPETADPWGNLPPPEDPDPLDDTPAPSPTPPPEITPLPSPPPDYDADPVLPDIDDYEEVPWWLGGS